MEDKKTRYAVGLFVAVEALKAIVIPAGAVMAEPRGVDTKTGVMAAAAAVASAFAVCVFSRRYGRMHGRGPCRIPDAALSGFAADLASCLAVYTALMLPIGLIMENDPAGPAIFAVIISNIFLAGIYLPVCVVSALIFFAGYGIIRAACSGRS